MLGLTVFLVVLSGAIGYQSSYKAPATPTAAELLDTQTGIMPVHWNPKQHNTNMLMCKSACDNKMKKYDVISGMCECKGE